MKSKKFKHTLSCECPETNKIKDAVQAGMDMMTRVSAYKISNLRKHQLEAIKKFIIIPSQSKSHIYVQIDGFGKWIAREQSPPPFAKRASVTFESPHDAIGYYKDKYGKINIYNYKRR